MNRIIIVVLMFLLIGNIVISQEADSTSVARKYELGEITVTSSKSKNLITQTTNLKLNQNNVSKSLNILPSVVLQNIGGRNELSVIIRGFDMRSIPVYIDGIPVYISYDGYVDLSRFKTFDYSVITASKGLTPMEYGANTIGGSINLVSIKPKEKLDVQAITGFGSGKKYEYGVNIGSRFNKFYFQGSYYGTQSDYFSLSEKYTATTFEDGGKRENSYSNDHKVNLKVGFTPNKKSEYSINYIFQHGEKGTPPYSGNDEFLLTRFWKWPAWDKQSLYFISKTKISTNSEIKIRMFYDKFYNKLESFDDNTYSSQTYRYTFTSIYDDHTWGGNFVLSNVIPKKNKLNLSLHYKNDFHKEHNVGEPIRNFNDYTFSAGLDDEFTISEKLNFTTGFSYNLRKSLQAENYDSNTETISEFPENENSAINAQLGTVYSFTNNNELTFYVANRTRFATLKDRYSYRLGRTIPNPDLKAEKALHYNLSYKTLFFEKWSIDASFYYIRLNNAIQQIDNVKPGISQMLNTGEAVFKGFEMATNYSFTKWAKLDVNYSFIERKNLSNPEIYFTDVPQHKIWANLSLNPVENLEINLNAEYNSKRYSTTYGTVAEEFDVYNLYFSYKINQFTIYTGVQNLMDKNYAYSEGFPAQGRNAFVKIMFQLN